MLLEAEDRGRIVHQHVGVEHEQAPLRERPSLRVLARRRGAVVRDASPLQVLPPRDRALSPCATRCRSVPAASSRNVLRSIPRYLRPYRAFLLDDIEQLADLLVRRRTAARRAAFPSRRTSRARRGCRATRPTISGSGACGTPRPGRESPALRSVQPEVMSLRIEVDHQLAARGILQAPGARRPSSAARSPEPCVRSFCHGRRHAVRTSPARGSRRDSASRRTP